MARLECLFSIGPINPRDNNLAKINFKCESELYTAPHPSIDVRAVHSHMNSAVAFDDIINRMPLSMCFKTRPQSPSNNAKALKTSEIVDGINIRIGTKAPIW